jgi:hypothetical protein
MKVAIAAIVLLLIAGRCSRDASKGTSDTSAPVYEAKSQLPASKHF